MTMYSYQRRTGNAWTRGDGRRRDGNGRRVYEYEVTHVQASLDVTAYDPDYPRLDYIPNDVWMACLDSPAQDG
jgi:hypothetical protein